MKSLMVPPHVGGNLQTPLRGPLKVINPETLLSPDALRRAWLKVRTAGGASGDDGVTLQAFGANLEKNLTDLRQDVLSNRYRPYRVKRIFVPKPNGGMRPLALWTVRDKILQRVVTDCISPYFELTFLNCSYGFRPGLGVADAIKAVQVHRQAQRRWVADVDIKDCFDSLNTRLLMRFVSRQVQDPLILRLINAWLKADVFNALTGPHTEAGASQGNVISPLLANVYLHQFDLKITRQGYHLVRYADDMLVLCHRRELAQQALETVAATLNGIDLKLNAQKSKVVHFDQGFQFLGYFFLRDEHFKLS